MAKKKVKIRKIRTSRKSYIPYYLMALVVLIIITYIKLKGLPMNKNLFIASIIFIIAVIKITEVHRMTHHYELTPHALEKVEGIFWQKIKRMSYHSINQLHLTQSLWDKLLDIGTVEVTQFSDTVRTEIKNIDKPREFIKEVSRLGLKRHEE